MTDKDFDDILINLGTSKWNFLHMFFFSLSGLMMPSLLLSGVFLVPNINHKCKPYNLEEAVNVEECHYVDLQNETKICNSWEYESEYFPTSMTQEYDLVCENAFLRPTYQSAYMFGNFIGDPLTGYLADRYGRRKLIVIGSIITVSSGLSLTLFTNIYLLILIRFVMGFSHSAASTTGYILNLEICEPKYRSAVACFIPLSWAIGTIWYGILGYLVKDWRWLQRISLLPGIIILIVLKYYSESPRWLIVNGKFDEALETLRHAAKLNRSVLPPEDEIINRMKRIQKSSLSETRSNTEIKTMKERMKHVISEIAILFSTPVMRKLVLLMYVLFFTAALVYYGLTLNATNFAIDPYKYMILGGIMEIPAYTILSPIINKFGRIPPTSISYLACGVVILVLAFIQKEQKWIVLTLAMMGRMLSSCAFQLIYVIALEVYPTEVRMHGIGTSQLVSRIGSITAPYVTETVAAEYLWIPSIIFGMTSVIAGLTTLLIPETLKSHLPETITMLELRYSKNKDKKVNNDIENGSTNTTEVDDAASEVVISL